MSAKEATPDLRANGVFVRSQSFIENAAGDTIGAKVIYDCSGVLVNIAINKDDPGPSQESQAKLIDLVYEWEDACSASGEEGVSAEQAKAVWKAMRDFMESVCHPILLKLRPEGVQDYSPSAPKKDLHSYVYPESHNLQIVVSDGKFEPIRRDDLPVQYRFEALPPENFKGLDIPCYHPRDTAILEMYRPWALKVSVGDNIMICKLNGSFQDSFAREFDLLKRITSAENASSIRVPKLKGLISSEVGTVGMLIEYIDTVHWDLAYALVNEGDKIEESDRIKWESQLTTTLDELHKSGVVWGDAKTSNLLLDKKLDLWVVDFGGGHTVGWVDRKLQETMEGDLSALPKILQDIRGETPRGDILHRKNFGPIPQVNSKQDGTAKTDDDNSAAGTKRSFEEMENSVEKAS